MSSNVYVIGVGITPFLKPGNSAHYPDMASQAIKTAIADASIEFKDIGQAYAGYVYADSTAGQRALYNVGMTGIPIINVNNNCATGSTALYLARQAIEGGLTDCALAFGFEEMVPGALGLQFNDRPTPFDLFDEVTQKLVDQDNLPLTIRYFGGAGLAHMHEFGTKLETFAKVRAKASRHGSNNPIALLKKVFTVEEVMESQAIWPGVLTKLMACPPTCGAAAAILCSEAFLKRHNIAPIVRIKSQAMSTDKPIALDGKDMREVVGFNMTETAVQEAYNKAGVSPEDIDVIELHDCFAQNELISYEALGLCPRGGAEKFIEDGDNTYGGKFVTNPSGGLLSKGHPLGATGLAQCTELIQQLRGTAEQRQVPGARLALQHNLGLGGACVVTIYEKV
jgi:acetyl-CoA acetyltransferase